MPEMEFTSKIQLREHQLKAVNFLVNSRHAILGDEPGLGKTFAAIMAAQWAKEFGPKEDKKVKPQVLVVVPPHLMQQWAREIKRWDPKEHVQFIFRGDPEPTKPGFYICAYQSIQNAGIKKLPWIRSRIWACVIFDEAHRMRNRSSQQFKNAQYLPSKYTYLLTGTPMENNPSDIWTLLHLCSPKDFTSYWNFVNEFMVTVSNPWKTNIISVGDWAQERFTSLMDKYMLRRLKTDHLPDLPKVIHDVRLVDLDYRVMKLHKEAKDTFRIEHPGAEDQIALSAGALIPMLRQLTGNPPAGLPNAKTAVIGEIMSDSPAQQYIIYTWHKSSAKAVFESDDLPKVNRYLITGEIDQDDRDSIVAAWMTDPTGILVGTLSTMSEGLNLQTCSTVFFYEHDYLPGAIEQAVARVQRMGQKANSILAYHIMGKATVDTTVYRVALNRHHRIQEALLEDLFRDVSDEERDNDLEM